LSLHSINKDRLSLTNPRDVLHHGKHAFSASVA